MVFSRAARRAVDILVALTPLMGLLSMLRSLEPSSFLSFMAHIYSKKGGERFVHTYLFALLRPCIPFSLKYLVVGSVSVLEKVQNCLNKLLQTTIFSPKVIFTK